MIIDTHAHYDDEAYLKDRELVLQEAGRQGVERIVNIGSTLNGAKETVKLAESHDFIYGAVGIHPSEVEELTEADMEWLVKAAAHDKIVAIGEIGLDYHYDEPDEALQKKWFGRQLEIAREVSLPISVHSRDAAKDTLEIMREYHAEEIGGVIHCFSYSWEMAKIFLDMGFYLGIGGVVTFSNGRKLKEIVEKMPLERIVLETDAPYLSPEPYRGARNHSGNLVFVAEEIARLKGIPVDRVYEATCQNALDMYAFPTVIA